jgi:biotin synthase-related radical SAM superfamily protein
VEEAEKTGNLQSISLTSGVEESPQLEARRVAEVVRDLLSFGVPIGVSISPFPGVNQILKDAGADEVKYNLETVDRELFARICPCISFQEIMDALQEAVAIFGRNRVFSNIIVGLGESDETLRQGIDMLTEMGVLPILRAAYPHPLRAGEVEIDRPSAERLLEMARYMKKKLDENDLDGRLAQTGCYRCSGCDLAPGKDL